VVNSVIDAVRHLGVRDIQMPCSPQTVWRAINAAQGQVKSTSQGATETAAGGGLGSIDASGGAR
jgi:carbon-monoxide dehydrogenase large subunit